jgi:hypothetical protein
MIGGTGRSVREREGGNWVGLARGELGRLDPGCGPNGLLASPFYFIFLLFSFSFVSDFCFEFLKRLLNSDLNKIKADHFWSLKRGVHNLKTKGLVIC